jgi:Tfp pilus assembly protein PilP
MRDFISMRFRDRGALLALALVIGGCGGDDAGGGAKPPAAPGAAAGAAPAKGAVVKAKLIEYLKIEDRVSEDERANIRHIFRDRDFVPDPTGTENRDPFRSYVVNPRGADSGLQPVPTDSCKKNQLVATNYGLHDLKLVMVVSRGPQRWAVFQDKAGLGHISRRNDCVGREKARVKDIGSGFVTLEITPDVVPNQAPRPPEERSMALYPDEVPIADSEKPDDSEGVISTSAPPPTFSPGGPMGGAQPSRPEGMRRPPGSP